MLQLLSDYSSLINIVLMGTMIGFLFHLSKASRQALLDKHSVELEAMKVKLQALEDQAKLDEKNHQQAVALLTQQMDFFRRLAEIPKERRTELLAQQSEEAILQLELQARRLPEPQASLAAEQAIALRKEVPPGPVDATVEHRQALQDAFMRVLTKAVKFTIDTML